MTPLGCYDLKDDGRCGGGRSYGTQKRMYMGSRRCENEGKAGVV